MDATPGGRVDECVGWCSRPVSHAGATSRVPYSPGDGDAWDHGCESRPGGWVGRRIGKARALSSGLGPDQLSGGSTPSRPIPTGRFRPTGSTALMLGLLLCAKATGQECHVKETRPMPERVVLVVDVSSSMKGKETEQALGFLRGFLSAPNDQLDVAVIAFGSGVHGVRDYAELPSAIEAAEIPKWVSSQGEGDSTQLVPALERAKALKPKAVLVVSDGCWFDGLGVVAEAQRLKVPVWVYHVGGKGSRRRAIQLAEVTGGGCYSP